MLKSGDKAVQVKSRSAQSKYRACDKKKTAVGVETIAMDAKANFSTTSILIPGGPTLSSPFSLALIVWAASTQALIAINPFMYHTAHIKAVSNKTASLKCVASPWCSRL